VEFEMATKKRRLILSLSAELDQAIDRLANAQERPRASVVVEILEQMVPQFNAFAEVVEESKSAPEEAFKKLFGTLFDVMSQGAILGQSMLAGKDSKDD
jgi:predicted DNA-binding protein